MPNHLMRPLKYTQPVTALNTEKQNLNSGKSVKTSLFSTGNEKRKEKKYLWNTTCNKKINSEA